MEKKLELLMTIVNEGYSEDVMKAAKSKGATGGTIIHGRGTAPKEAETFFNITITPEKEIVLIVVSSDIKESIMHEIYNCCGPNSEAKGICFSLPIDEQVGLNFKKITTKVN